jgi:nicotinamide riboside transporter PnuC
VEAAIYWLTAIAALIGVWCNIHRNVACFWIWSITNAIWVVADIRHGIYPQAVLQFIYFNLAIYGIWKWTHDGTSRQGDA